MYLIERAQNNRGTADTTRIRTRRCLLKPTGNKIGTSAWLRAHELTPPLHDLTQRHPSDVG